MTADPPPSAARPPRPSSTLVVVRDSPSGIEVLLLRRAERGDQNSGAWVFPGGLVDAADRDCAGVCAGLDDAAASARLGVPEGGLAYYVAAIRECFEECGLLFATQSETPGAPLVAIDASAAIDLDAWRGPLHRNERLLRQLCEEAGLRLALDRLHYFSHWVTPLGRPKRFDTRFFIAVAPPAQQAAHDAAEMVAQQWLRPGAALAQSDSMYLMTPTLSTLEVLARFDSTAALMTWAAARRHIALTVPHLGSGSQGERPVLPHEPAWAEIRRIDPAGIGTASYEIVAGRPVRLSPRVIRITANNGGMMTGPGTNSYLVAAHERNEWALIDPGPIDAAHVDALLAAAPGPIRWIFATHTHIDHSPAAVLLRERTGATVYGRLPDHPERQDASFAPDTALQGGERIVLDAGTTLRVVHTPGHASNHLCFLLEEEKTLFTGDHVMQSSTVVINPPDGDMAAYIASLHALRGEDIDWLAPGHGFLMAEPHAAIEAIVAHRARRESKVLDALRRLQDADDDALLAAVYDDVPPQLHAMAARSLLAHLLKLQGEGAVQRVGERWVTA